jgi:hypothetical protein
MSWVTTRSYAMPDYKEVVIGRIIDTDGKPVPGAEVAVYDKDLLVDDHLGAAVTDDVGRFRANFKWSDFKETRLEERPDIFVKVTNPRTGTTTQSPVFRELKGQLVHGDTVEILDLGDIEVS